MTELDFGSDDTRRLPVYLLLGLGNSMAGAAGQAVEQGIQLLHSELLGQPDAVERIWLSVLTFADSAQQLVPLTPIALFSPPPLIVGTLHNLGAGLQLLLEVIERELTLNTPDRKGDYKPLVFLIFDNEPTDNWEQQLAPLQRARREGKLGMLVALGCGDEVNTAVLREITESVVLIVDITPDVLRSFFQWTSVSVTTVSRSTAQLSGGAVVTLPSPPDDFQIIV